MPKKIEVEEEAVYEEEAEDQDMEEEVQRVEKKQKKFIPKVPVKEEPVEVKRRFVAFHQPETFGVADAESGEAISSRPDISSVLLEVLADVTERLERIENNLGSMMST